MWQYWIVLQQSVWLQQGLEHRSPSFVAVAQARQSGRSKLCHGGMQRWASSDAVPHGNDVWDHNGLHGFGDCLKGHIFQLDGSRKEV